LSLTDQETTPKRHWPSVFQFVLSLIALLGTMALALFAFLGVITDQFSQSLNEFEIAGTLMTGFALLAASSFLLISALYAYKGMRGELLEIEWLNRIQNVFRKRRGWFLLGSLATGGLVSNADFGLFALAPIHSWAVIAIFLFTFFMAADGILHVSKQRFWGVLTSGMFLAPLAAIPLEIAAGLLGLFALIAYIGSQAAYSGLFGQLSDFQGLLNNQGELFDTLNPLADDPIVFGMALFFIAFLVPIIEELLKPIGLYLSLGRNWTPANGFALGALSGAGFALFENLTLAIASTQWLPVMIARIGTSSMHILTSGIFGWAIVRAKLTKRYWLAFWGFAISVLLHGLWNGLTIATSFSSLINEDSARLSFSPSLTNGMLFGLLILGLGSIFLLRFNRKQLLGSKE
jgi:hypothetical protein